MYKHIFFDLDHTLWDFEQNSKEALHEIFIDFKLEKLLHCSFTEFINVYHQINHAYWDDYKKGKVTREKLRNGRFHDTLSFFQISNNTLGIALSESYISRSPYKTQLFEGAIRVLDYLKHKNYALHIITNGFNEVQFIKLTESGLLPYFLTITTSEHAGYNKPDEKIFEHALAQAAAKKHESIMIGDNIEADIVGAIQFGIDAIWFNPNKDVHHSNERFHTIHHLLELEEIF
ncbi:MAG TPA: YjjG family noncanonical pyrimidine nucleotidase [Bacteroidia bacterium]|nr:YjjG family noncanonical pyrimidine nucleotidase [Bacteroidia bacterium]